MFFSRSADILVPISRFDAQKNCIPPLASHSNSSRTLLYSILSLHPTSRASDLSAPDRRDLRTRTSNLRDQIWVSIPLPPCLLGHYDLDNDIRRSRNAAGNEKTHRLPGSAFPPGRLSGKPSPFHFHPDSSQWRMLLGRLVGLLIYQFGAAAFTYPLSPSFPLAHAKVPSSADDYPVSFRNGGPLNQGTRPQIAILAL